MVYPPAYQQVLKGLPAVDYSARDIVSAAQCARPPRLWLFAGAAGADDRQHRTRDDFDEWLARIICYAFCA